MPTNMDLHKQVMHALRQEIPQNLINTLPKEANRQEPPYVKWQDINMLANERLEALGVRWETNVGKIQVLDGHAVCRVILTLSSNADYHHVVEDVGMVPMNSQAPAMEVAVRSAVKRCWGQLGLGDRLFQSEWRTGQRQAPPPQQQTQQPPQQQQTDPATEDAILQRFWTSCGQRGWDAHVVQECLGSTWQVWQQSFPNAHEATRAAWQRLTDTNGAPRGQQQQQSAPPPQQQGERVPHHYCKCGAPVFDERFPDCYACNKAPWRTPGWCVSCGQEAKPEYLQCYDCKQNNRAIPSGPGNAAQNHQSGGYDPDDDLPF